jgi:hypothetical protein
MISKYIHDSNRKTAAIMYTSFEYYECMDNTFNLSKTFRKLYPAT